MKIGFFAAMVLVAGAPQAAAQDRSEGEAASALADDLAKCRDITVDAARLACFDRASAALLDARAAGNLVFVDREGMRKAKRAVFGFSLPKIRLFGDGRNDRAEPEVREIESTLRSVRQAGNGMYLFQLADDSQWETTEARTGFFPRAGKPIKVEAGLLGSYSASVDGKRAIRVKRVR